MVALNDPEDGEGTLGGTEVLGVRNDVVDRPAIRVAHAAGEVYAFHGHVLHRGLANRSRRQTRYYLQWVWSRYSDPNLLSGRYWASTITEVAPPL